MDYLTFSASQAGDAPPSDLASALQALWWDRKGEWDKAHALADQEHGPANDWVHAYLHRKEGDRGNASYWYRRAGQPFPSDSLEAEWAAIARTLFDAG